MIHGCLNHDQTHLSAAPVVTSLVHQVESGLMSGPVVQSGRQKTIDERVWSQNLGQWREHSGLSALEF